MHFVLRGTLRGIRRPTTIITLRSYRTHAHAFTLNYNSGSTGVHDEDSRKTYFFIYQN